MWRIVQVPAIVSAEDLRILLEQERTLKAAVAGAIRRYPEVMSGQTIQLLEAFEALPAEEKRIVANEIFRRAMPYDSGALDDEEIAHAADALLATLDDEEYDAEPR